MKLRLLICTVLLALLVVPAFADSVTFTNKGFENGGQLFAGSSGVNATNAMITGLSLNGSLIASGDLGALNFDTGIFTGSLQNGGSFTGGTFSIGAAVFNNFAGTLTNMGKGLYDLVGTFSGTFDGLAFTGSTNQVFSSAVVTTIITGTTMMAMAAGATCTAQQPSRRQRFLSRAL